MKIKILLFISITIFYNQRINAQTWQNKYQISAIPKHISESSNGDLEVHFFNPTDSTWFKFKSNQLGDSLGIEFYIPKKRNYHTIDTQNSQQFLTYWDTLDIKVWEIPISVPSNTTVTTSFSNLAFLNHHNVIDAVTSNGTIWIYDQNGNLVFDEFAENPFSMSGWAVKPKLDGTTHLTKWSDTGWLPQGAQETYAFNYLLDTLGNIVCENSGLSHSVNNNSKIVEGIAINGSGLCGSVGSQKKGLIPSNLIEGQFTPCTSFIIPPDSAFTSNIEMIGLQSDAFAVIGYEFGELTLTRIDCSNPIHEELCLYENPAPVFGIWTPICYGEEFIFWGDTLISNGVYQTTISDSNGCDSIAKVEIFIIPSNPQINPELETGDGTGFIKLNPNCSDCTYLWSNGSTSDSISNLDYGIYSVTVTVFGECEYLYEFNLEMISSTKEDNQNEDIHIYPNFCIKGEMVTLKADFLINPSIKIYNLEGKLIKNIPDIKSSNYNFFAPNISGIYIVQIKDKGLSLTNKKLIVN